MQQNLDSERHEEFDQAAGDVTSTDEAYRASCQVAHHLEVRMSPSLISSSPLLIGDQSTVVRAYLLQTHHHHRQCPLRNWQTRRMSSIDCLDTAFITSGDIYSLRKAIAFEFTDQPNR